MTSTGFGHLAVYRLAGEFADDVRAHVVSWDPLDAWSAGIQLLRAADSVPANIAEGTGRRTLRDQARFFLIARGSLHETQHLLTRATARKLPLPENALTAADQVGRMLNGLIRSTLRRAASS